MNQKPVLYVGIDSGTSTGYAVWNSRLKKFEAIETLKIHQAMDRVKELFTSCAEGELFVRVEDARQRKWFGDADARAARSGAGIREGIGAVKRDAVIWEDFLTDLGVKFQMAAPKNNKTKLNAQQFKNYTQYDGTTSGHGRDAAMLVFQF